jgi:hypothetical protein
MAADGIEEGKGTEKVNEAIGKINADLAKEGLAPFEQVAALIHAQMTPELLREHAEKSLMSMISNYQIQEMVKTKLKPELELVVEQVLKSSEFRDALKAKVNEQLIGIADTAALQLCSKLIKALELHKIPGGKG